MHDVVKETELKELKVKELKPASEYLVIFNLTIPFAVKHETDLTLTC